MVYEDFLKLGVPFLGVPIIRTLVFWGLYWGSPNLGIYHIRWGRGAVRLDGWLLGVGATLAGGSSRFLVELEAS